MLPPSPRTVGVGYYRTGSQLGVGRYCLPPRGTNRSERDVFASLSIGFDKPQIGDFVVFNDAAGTIEHIGLKTTASAASAANRSFCANAVVAANHTNR